MLNLKFETYLEKCEMSSTQANVLSLPPTALSPLNKKKKGKMN